VSLGLKPCGSRPGLESVGSRPVSLVSPRPESCGSLGSGPECMNEDLESGVSRSRIWSREFLGSGSRI
jgi:hypothetical protein